MTRSLFVFLIACPILLAHSCKEPFLPPESTHNLNLLVVDGIINNGPDSTILRISRTRNLGDTLPLNPEIGASVLLQGQAGDRYSLVDLGGGRYGIDQLALNRNETYQLKISTGNGDFYASDFMPVKQTPPIDSLHWQKDSTGVTIYVNTHDPTDSSRYYRWTYLQTWEHRSFFSSTVKFENGQILPRSPDEQIYRCWISLPSTDITLGNSANLQQDLIDNHKILSIPLGSQQISLLYSLEVQQYSLTAESYAYWQNLKTSTEQLGTLFDPAPGQVSGNIHSLTHPEEPVMGFLSISSVSKSRIFISIFEMGYWPYYSPYGDCRATGVGSDPATLDYYFGNGVSTPFLQNGKLESAFTFCVDCRNDGGGSNQKPDFWPN
jgi:hypothetical protein